MVCMAALYNSTYHANIYDVLDQSNISWPPFGARRVLYYQFQCLNTSSLILGHGSTGHNLSILSQKEKYQTFTSNGTTTVCTGWLRSKGDLFQIRHLK